MRPLFCCLVVHGRRRFPRRNKKGFKRDYLRLISEMSRHLYEREHGRLPSARHSWRHARRLRVEVSCSPTTGASR